MTQGQDAPGGLEPPPLQAFLDAAERGRRVRVLHAAAGGLLALGDDALLPAGSREVAARPLFEAAMCAHYGSDVAQMALREIDDQVDLPSGAMPSAAVQHAAGCAEGMCTLNDARRQVLRMEYSAVLLGRRFVALCAELGIAAAMLPLERRQAIDQAMGGHGGPAAELPAERLRQLLLRPPLQ